MGVFDSASFDELSDGSSQYAGWSKPGLTVVKKIPGGSKNVIQKIGVGMPKLALAIKGTKAQMTALLAKVGDEGSLTFNFETTTARLESMEPPTSIGIDNDLYTSTLNFLRSSGGITALPSNLLRSDAGNRLTDNSGGYLTHA